MIDRILNLMDAHNITAAKLTSDLEIANSSITDWKKRKSRPSTEAIIKIANYFNVSTDYLLTGKEYKNDKESTNLIQDLNIEKKFYITDSDERNLITGFRKLNDKNKGIILGKLESILEIYTNDKIFELYAAEKETVYDICNDKKEPRIKHLPILGQTAAGFPIDIIEVGGGDYVEVPETADADYALFVNGDSMSPMIQDKDLVFIKSMPEVENGTICVVDIDGAVTCKKIHRFNGRIELISLNEDYAPIIINMKDRKPFRIIGKVTYCQRPNTDFFAI